MQEPPHSSTCDTLLRLHASPGCRVALRPVLALRHHGLVATGELLELTPAGVRVSRRLRINRGWPPEPRRWV